MDKKFIDLRVTRDIGGMITAYFDFLKHNIKSFLNIFISYNGLFILAFLGISYLLATGFIGSISELDGITNSFNSKYELYLIIGGLGFVVIYLITSVLNYSLAASYMVHYVDGRGADVDKRSVWEKVRDNLGRIILFIVLMTLLYIGVMFAGIVVSFVPVLGMFAYYFIILGFTGWMGLSFMVMMDKDKEVTDALGTGWTLLTTHFWKVILSNLIISMLVGLLMIVVLMIPGILIGFYTFHAVDSGIDMSSSIISTALWTLALSILLVMYVLQQALVQFINGVIYYSVNEETYNEAARERINNIGRNE